MASCGVLASNHATLYGHLSDVTWVDFSVDVLATCSSDKTVRLWDFSNTDNGITEFSHSPLLGHRYTVHCCCFSATGTMLASCSMDGYLIIWNPKTGGIIETLQHPSQSGIRVCKFSPNSAYLATGSEDDTLAIWDVATKTLLRTLSGHDASVTACNFTPDNNYIISGSTNGDLRLWDVKRGDSLPLAYESEGHDLGVMGCEFSCEFFDSDGVNKRRKRYLLATCGNDNSVRLFNVIVGSRNAISLSSTLQSHEGNVMCCRFSSNGKLLASASGDKTVILWNVQKRSIILKLIGHERYVTSCAFSLCNRYIASGSNDKTVIVWKITGDSADVLVNVLSHRPSLEVDSASEVRKPKECLPVVTSTLPDEFLCPITHEVMQNPVIAADGFTYERKAISEWLNSGKASSPMTNQTLPHAHLIPNYALKMLIQRHLEL